MSALRASTITAVFTALLTLPVAGQDLPEREGFWLNVGLGVGSAGASCSGCEDLERSTGVSGNLTVGGTLDDRVLLGLGMHGWTKSENSVDMTVGSLAGIVSFYPSPTGSLWLQGGLGVMLSSFTEQTSGLEVSATGLSMVVGAGYDVPVSGNLSIAPYVNFLVSAGGSTEVTDGTVTVSGGFDFNPNFVQFGLSLTAH